MAIKLRMDSSMGFRRTRCLAPSAAQVCFSGLPAADRSSRCLATAGLAVACLGSAQDTPAAPALSLDPAGTSAFGLATVTDAIPLPELLLYRAYAAAALLYASKNNLFSPVGSVL
jgi:hypothetical protein